MGTSWSVRLVPIGVSGERARAAIEGVLNRIVAQMSHWEPGSDLSRFNRSPLESWQMLPPELSRVLGAGLAVAAKSGGAFDPAMGALADLWGFGPGGTRPFPSEDAVREALARSGSDWLEHDRTLFSARRMRGVALDFSGIAKGYAVDAVAAALRELGCADFLVEIGGELRGEGVRPDAQPWWVDLEAVPGADLPGIRVALHGLSAATSGDYRRWFAHDGRSYSHTIDPRDGMPVTHGVASVTVLHTECMWADAWATALTVLGPVDGPLVAEREGLAVVMVVREGSGFRELLSPALLEMLD